MDRALSSEIHEGSYRSVRLELKLELFFRSSTSMSRYLERFFSSSTNLVLSRYGFSVPVPIWNCFTDRTVYNLVRVGPNSRKIRGIHGLPFRSVFLDLGPVPIWQYQYQYHQIGPGTGTKSVLVIRTFFISVRSQNVIFV